jgi:lipid-A-disaccharide synthase-like uncharacterized protein
MVRGRSFNKEGARMEILGWLGTALVIIAYFPQIRHLAIQRCAWGISVATWVIWLIASALLLSYCIIRGDFLLCFVQSVNIVAILLTIILVISGNRICPFHTDLVSAQTETGLLDQTVAGHRRKSTPRL